MDNRLLREVNCESCDHLLYLMNRKDEFCGYACESEMESVELTETFPLHWLTCHSLYESWEMHEEAIADGMRDDAL